jgi:hypothetical protein
MSSGVAKGAEPVFCPSPISILRMTSTPFSRNFFNQGASTFCSTGAKLIEFVRIEDTGLNPYLVAPSLHRRLGSLDNPFKFSKLGNLVAMLRL